MVAAGALQVLAGLAASALAALDDYVTAAAGFVSGSVAGLALILVLIDHHGVQAVAWGMALNGCDRVARPEPRARCPRQGGWAQRGERRGRRAPALRPRRSDSC